MRVQSLVHQSAHPSLVPRWLRPHRPSARQVLGGRKSATKFFGTLGRSTWTCSRLPLGTSSTAESVPEVEQSSGPFSVKARPSASDRLGIRARILRKHGACGWPTSCREDRPESWSKAPRRLGTRYGRAPAQGVSASSRSRFRVVAVSPSPLAGRDGGGPSASALPSGLSALTPGEVFEEAAPAGSIALAEPVAVDDLPRGVERDFDGMPQHSKRPDRVVGSAHGPGVSPLASYPRNLREAGRRVRLERVEVDRIGVVLPDGS